MHDCPNAYLWTRGSNGRQTYSLGAFTARGVRKRSGNLRVGEDLKVQEPVHIAEHAGEARDRGLDETLIDTFPCSDPFSSIPNPAIECPDIAVKTPHLCGCLPRGLHSPNEDRFAADPHL
jgi:hypothetical protein